MSDSKTKYVKALVVDDELPIVEVLSDMLYEIGVDEVVEIGLCVDVGPHSSIINTSAHTKMHLLLVVPHPVYFNLVSCSR